MSVGDRRSLNATASSLVNCSSESERGGMPFTKPDWMPNVRNSVTWGREEEREERTEGRGRRERGGERRK